MTISCRPEIPEDEPFLRALILQNISEELAALEWPEPMRGQLLEMQSTARRRAIRTARPGARSEIIVADGASAGWLVVAEQPSEIRLMEIMILHSLRGRGVGSTVVRNLLAEAGGARKPLRLSVSATNAGAIRLYERLGFRRIGGDEIRRHMEAAPWNDDRP
jgi:ribosomal protein S18 acetylase RimI-like enzyme